MERLRNLGLSEDRRRARRKKNNFNQFSFSFLYYLFKIHAMWKSMWQPKLHEINFIIFIIYVSIFHISHLDEDYFNTISINQE